MAFIVIAIVWFVIILGAVLVVIDVRDKVEKEFEVEEGIYKIPTYRDLRDLGK